MTIFRKILFGVFIIFALALGFWAYLSLKNSKKPKVDALTMLPDSCLIYFSTSDFFGLDKKLNSQSLIVDKLKMFKDINSFCTTLRQFDSLLTTRPRVKEEISENIIHFALYGSHLNWISTFNIRQLGEQEKVNEEFSRLFDANKIDKNIYSFGLGGKEKFYFSLTNGVVIISSNKETMLKALEPSAKKLCNNPSFLGFKSTLSENGLLSAYIDQGIYQKNEAALKLNLPDICRQGYYSGVVDIQPSEVKINGYLKPDSSGIISLFGSQEPQKPDFIDDLPYACNYFQAYGFSTFSEIKIKLDRQKPKMQMEFWEMINDSALYNVRDAFYANIGNVIVDFESGASRQKFVLLGLNDTLLAKEHLKLMSDTILDRNRMQIFSLKKTRQGEFQALLAPLSDCATVFATIYHSLIYFSENEDDLSQLLYSLKGNLVLSEHESFIAYKNQNFPETFNYLVYNIPALDKTKRSSFFDFETDSKSDPFETFKHFSFFISNQKKHMEFRWHLLNETETLNKEQNILWALQLDTVSTMKAQPFVNHTTKENELLIQDDGLTLYLVNAKGTALWKRRLSEKITSPIFMVDIFKNGRYQLLFSSRNQIHLMDRNGNYINGYPLNLPAEACSPLSVFDYDNTRDYRIFVACKNNQIYNYSISGKRQQGFVPFHTDSKVRLPIQYIKVGLSDYLVALDEEGKIYTFSRRGEGRIGLRNKATANCQAFYLDVTGNVNSTNFIYTDDKNSLINKISLADKKSIIKLNYGVENAGVNFCQTGDKKTARIIFSKLNAMIAYDLNGNLLSNRTFENDLSESDYYEDEARSVYLTRSYIRDELLVYDVQRQKTKLFGATSLPLVSDLFNDNKKYLVITNGNRLSCVLLN